MSLASTCIYKDTRVVYMPSVTNSASTLYKILLFAVLVNIGLSLLIEGLFRHKSNLLITLETMQLLSYLYYFSSPLS